MPKILDVLRLQAESGLSERAKAANLTWPLPPELNDTALEAMLFPKTRRRPKKWNEPD
ncbi:hypothetical protein [Paenibacillus alkaliterrae]|uniref:hypothetical protein n=1 Tax=Paenibacillus alkaliterrae TaxID=320909 RepID=UPI0039EE0B56